ncbi:hypothetical protein F511_06946 [Dorcoceras hygrometricum]|uniref:Uncharacterized protein n=1 Tax=Dorcoceras hygrometricum TaxID=472368 RepID=A0A2Z7CXK1_9LAMI|nr:hypothetical protein F511_06946 [Dorcoceras hygrometricum]
MRDLRATRRARLALDDRAAAREAARMSRPAIAQSPGHLALVARPARDVRSSIVRPAHDGVARARRGCRRRTWRRPGDSLLEFCFPIDSKPEIQYCGRYRQSGPRPDTRLLCHPALEGVTRSARTDSPRRIGRKQFSGEEGGGGLREERGWRPRVGIQLAVGPQPLRLRNHNSGLAHRIMVKRLATSPHDPLGITDSSCKNQLVVVSVQYGPFNPYIPIRSTTIGKSRVAIDPIAMHTSWRSNSDIASVTSIGYPRMSASGESSTTMHRLLHASGSHPIPTPYDPNTTKTSDLSTRKMVTTWKVRTEGSSIDHQVTIYLHAQNITMFPTNETWYFASQILVSNSGGLILILTAQSTRNMFRIHNDY